MRKAGIVCLLALLAATFGLMPLCFAQTESGIIFFCGENRDPLIQ